VATQSNSETSAESPGTSYLFFLTAKVARGVAVGARLIPNAQPHNTKPRKTNNPGNRSTGDAGLFSCRWESTSFHFEVSGASSTTLENPRESEHPPAIRRQVGFSHACPPGFIPGRAGRERKVRTPQSSVPDNVREDGWKSIRRKVPQKTYRPG
jgi:hypothetical protein